jgi:hypothetical protein
MAADVVKTPQRCPDMATAVGGVIKLNVWLCLREMGFATLKDL